MPTAEGGRASSLIAALSQKGSLVGRLMWTNDSNGLRVPKGPFRIAA
jgi:hypothetical protein